MAAALVGTVACGVVVSGSGVVAGIGVVSCGGAASIAGVVAATRGPPLQFTCSPHFCRAALAWAHDTVVLIGGWANICDDGVRKRETDSTDRNPRDRENSLPES